MTIQKKTLFQRGDESLFLFDGLFSLVNNNQFRSLPWQQNKIRVFGKEYNEPRLTCYFGPKYTYSNIHWPESPMHPIVQELFNMVCEASEFDFNAVLCNFYRNGADSMGWHADNEKEIDQKFIGSVSFGGTRKIHFRNLSSMEKFSVE
ncbi:MAG: alpha-ketoglutarate-dependent dioxygenase AlkB, partial [Bacteroidota bacterium]